MPRDTELIVLLQATPSYATAKKQPYSGGKIKLLGFDTICKFKRIAQVSSLVGGYERARCECEYLCVFSVCKYARTSKAYAYPRLKTSVVANNWCVCVCLKSGACKLLC